MGAWGTASFENDDAADWVYELEDSEDLTPIEAALDTALGGDNDYLELPEGAAAIAAAEVVAILLGRPPKQFPAEVKAWVAGRRQPNAKLVSKAQRAVRRILGDTSEIAELWRESDDFRAWQSAVQGLLKRLQPPPDAK